jgi:hypothetical protein
MNLVRFLIVVGLAGGVVGSAVAQGFNIDLDIGFGPPEGGNGAPSAGFAGAAGQAGFWNRVPASGPSSPVTLSGLDGSPTGAQIYATGGLGSSGGSGWTINTGDYRLLLNDYVVIGDAIQYHFTGFQPGRYLVYTYAVNAAEQQVSVQVNVPGAVVPTAVSTGPMPGNQFILGVTHTLHDLTITGSSFEINVSGPWPNSECNGFQIVAVPEPCSALALAAGIATLLRRRRAG